MPAAFSEMWRDTLCDRERWASALRLGLPVGLAQVLINQGDLWLSGHITSGVVAKTIASPTLSVGIALVAAAAAARRHQSPPPHAS